MLRLRFWKLRSPRAAIGLGALLAIGCFRTPDTTVILDNAYEPSSLGSRVLYRAAWQAVTWDAAVPPGASSEPQPTVPASDNTAYVLVAPGWDASSASPPTSFVVMQSEAGYAVDLYDTLHIGVDDATFLGSCTAQRPLTQAQADFITQVVFADVFKGLAYDATNCTTSAQASP